VRLRDLGWTVYSSVRHAGDAPEGTTELVFDVTDPVAVGHAAVSLEELDALVDNAGIAIAAPLEFLLPEELTRQLDVNVVGQLRVIQAFLPALRRSRGRIVLMGSIGGRSALPFLGAYAMSKFALEAMADSLRVELAPFGVHVSIVEPGTIATAIWTKPQRSVEEFPPEAAARSTVNVWTSSGGSRPSGRPAERCPRLRSRRRSSARSPRRSRRRATSSGLTRSAEAASRSCRTACATGCSRAFSSGDSEPLRRVVRTTREVANQREESSRCPIPGLWKKWTWTGQFRKLPRRSTVAPAWRS
jgi:NAD(P)-dependent dehydrogenase (short-subunit alcohol dehydrogenase family)